MSVPRESRVGLEVNALESSLVHLVEKIALTRV